ncbi:hypothetical protein PPERSA_10051 [Pseudocohnilembus persalinus]|uniref:Uncharacterized protein n=1 Tax=Pseudocohnilembus persalinus TaxID=266149 RepID=A0A0V0QJP9_PSEPJ|nr:hypothetical protein PPERSA_10051 [Pseudocohnilembus persalinus]|eukprot:KRX02434.1 hypothetical protein PPERSA_10051 [Pseudocohnilembus persalinus]
MWNIASSNQLVTTRKTTEDQKRHLINLAYAKKQIDTKKPWVPQHSLTKFKNKYYNNWTQKINIENYKLLNKMMTIEKQKTTLNPEIQKKQQKNFKSLYPVVVKSQQTEIASENKELIKRLQNAKSNYGPKMWREQNKCQQYRNNLQQKYRKKGGSQNQYIDYSELAKMQLPPDSKVFLMNSTYQNNSNYSRSLAHSQQASTRFNYKQSLGTSQSNFFPSNNNTNKLSQSKSQQNFNLKNKTNFQFSLEKAVEQNQKNI